MIMTSIKDIYKTDLVPKLMSELALSNIHQVPKLVKIVINIGIGDSAQNAKAIESAVNELTRISGQKPVITRAKKSVAGFKVREGMPVGVTVTLRGDIMYDFVSKLVGIVLPRLRDFRGLNEKAFDGVGNYNIGIKDQLVFPEINYDEVQRLRGMNITLVTTSRSDVHALALLKHMGFPFRKVTVEKPVAIAS
jgi:large subunit ribosomal protein L5